MCGIAGILNLTDEPVGRDLLTALTQRLSHRGPDAEGVWLRGPLGLGHRRLSIIDLAGGKQPMADETGQVVITFNGEVYNFQELAAELRAAGYQFRTRSDTEVVLQAWRHWGEQCVDHFRGMFAFGIVDWNRQVLFLARDHFGIKPLLYTRNDHRFAFASELQALRGLPDFPREIDREALDHYLSLVYIPAPKTIFQGVQKLPAAHWLLVHFDGRTVGPVRYWSPCFDPAPASDFDDWVAEFAAVLTESVRAHLVADVPFGAFLSGGTDSTAIVGMMAGLLKEPVRTFSIGFKPDRASELPYARVVAEKWQTEHYEGMVADDALAILPRLLRHYGEPFGDSSAIPTFHVCRLARAHVPMVLSGDGGDEGFGGYGWYADWLQWLDPRPRQRPAWKALLRRMAGSLFPGRFPPLRQTAGARTPEAWQQIAQGMPSDCRRRLWRPADRAVVDQSVAPLATAFAESLGLHPLKQAQYLDYQIFLPSLILHKVDIASMCHGLEVRVPFIDRRVFDLVARLPVECTLYRDRVTGAYCRKEIIKRYLARDYPAGFVNRPKRGFSLPVEQWFCPGGTLRQELEQWVLGPDARLLQFFEPATVIAMLRDYRRIDLERAHDLWLLLALETWLRQE